jgi:hypothetical protein
MGGRRGGGAVRCAAGAGGAVVVAAGARPPGRVFFSRTHRLLKPAHRREDEIFFGYIVCMGLSTGVSRQKYFQYFVKNIRNITNVTPRTSAPVGAPRRPESPSDDIVAGRASFRWGCIRGGAPATTGPARHDIYFLEILEILNIISVNNQKNITNNYPQRWRGGGGGGGGPPPGAGPFFSHPLKFCLLDFGLPRISLGAACCCSAWFEHV